MNQPLLYLLTLATLCASSGAGCSLRRQVADPVPIAFTQPPTLDDVIRVVNSNSDPVQRLQAEGLSLKVPGYPALRGDLALERPHRLRLRGQLMGLSQELDLGSNDELFWMWIKGSQPPGIYYLRHDQYVGSQAAEALALDPHLLMDALGLVHLDPTGQHEGPYADSPGRLKIISRVPSATGPTTRVLVVHDKYGWVLEQHHYDPQGRLVATAAGSSYRYYPLHNVSLPQQVQVQLFPPSGVNGGASLQVQLEISHHDINRLTGDPTQLWAVPQIDGYPLVNLAGPVASAQQVPVRGAPPPQYNQSYEAQQRFGYRPRYRGLE